MRTKATAFVFLFVLVLTACTARPAEETFTWQEQYDLGVRYLEEGNYEEAIIAFTAAIEIDPRQAPAYVGRGDAYVLSGETEDNLSAAKADYEKAIELDKLLAEAYLGLADTYVAMGDSESAVNILRQGAEAVGDDTLFRDYINELTAGMEQSPGSSQEPTSGPAPSGPRVERMDDPYGGYRFLYYDEAENLTQEAL